MFKFLWKLIKWTVIYPVIFLLVATVAWMIIDPEGYNESSAKIDQERIEKCIADIGSDNCTEDGFKTQAYKDEQKRIRAEEKAERERIEAKEKAERERIEAEEKAEKDRTYNITTSGRVMCRYAIKQSAKYPSEVKFNYFKNFEERLWENFNKDSSMPHRYSMNVSGKMMNGFGNMIPFNAHCKLDLPTNGDGKLVDIWVK